MEGEEAIQIRAFRGSRRSSVYREHLLAERVFVRILEAAEHEGFTLLASLDRYGPHELDKASARRLADEVTRLRASAALPDLDEDLTAIAEVASWCGRATDDSWLRIEGP
jgi:hypothetical protein